MPNPISGGKGPGPQLLFNPGRTPTGRPEWFTKEPGFGRMLVISGVTRDAAGAALGGCTVCLFRTRDNAEIDQTVSDGSGNYSFLTASPAETYYAVAYKAGAPDVTGVTANTLVGS